MRSTLSSSGGKRGWRGFVPAPLLRRFRRWRRGAIYRGDYATWGEARADSEGYDAGQIFEKTLAAARAVRSGDAAWERDTVLFHEPAVDPRLLSLLREVAAAEGGRLNLLDFGGSLGSTWMQYRKPLGSLAEIRWNVVEQRRLVEAGQQEFSDGQLRFYGSVADACVEHPPSVVLLSSVLPYLESPHDLLAELRARPFRHLIVDRTGFVRRRRDRLTVQRVPPAIYPASYPCWFFDHAALLRDFAADWMLVAEWANDDEVDIDAWHGGFYLRRKL